MKNFVRAAAVLAAGLSGCLHRAPSPPIEAVDLLVIAPHPDDEVLMAGGVLEQAVKEGRRAAVIVVTNGDLGCSRDRDGAVREAETVSALAALGVSEDHVHFLGYPDGHLDQLGATALPPVASRAPDGRCTTRDATIATRGLGRRDEHTRRTGRPAPFTAAALTEDLAALLGLLAPHDVYLPHGIDTHPDHAATYVFFRRALAGLNRGPLVVHRAVVHADACWPTDCVSHYAPDAPLPPLPPPLDHYLPTEHVAVDARRKLELIARYPSQCGPHAETDWLAGFARREEAFFTETLRRDATGRWTAAEALRAIDSPVPEGAPTPLAADHRLAASLRGPQLVLRAGDRLLTRWPLIGAQPPFLLRVETRGESPGYAEWNLWAGGEFVGTRVLAVLP